MSILITPSAFLAKCLLNKAYSLSRSNALPAAAGAEAASPSAGRSQGSAGVSRRGSPAPGMLLVSTGDAHRHSSAPCSRQASPFEIGTAVWVLKCVFLKALHNTVAVLIHVFLMNLSGNVIIFKKTF